VLRARAAAAAAATAAAAIAVPPSPLQAVAPSRRVRVNVRAADYHSNWRTQSVSVVSNNNYDNNANNGNGRYNGNGTALSTVPRQAARPLPAQPLARPTPGDLNSRYAGVLKHFPTALGIDDFIARVEVALCYFGFTGDNTIGAPPQTQTTRTSVPVHLSSLFALHSKALWCSSSARSESVIVVVVVVLPHTSNFPRSFASLVHARFFLYRHMLTLLTSPARVLCCCILPL
jgi:hypothetical protein